MLPHNAGHLGNGSEAPVPSAEPSIDDGFGPVPPNAWPSGLPSLPSFSALAGQHLHSPIRPRIRRHDVRPPGDKKKTKQSASSNPANQGVESLNTLPTPHKPPVSAASHHRNVNQHAERPLPIRVNNGRYRLPPTTRFAQFSHMPDICLRPGGNATVSDLEVDLEVDPDNDTLAEHDEPLLAAKNVDPPTVDTPQQQIEVTMEQSTASATVPIPATIRPNDEVPPLPVSHSQPQHGEASVTPASMPPPDESLPLSLESLALLRHAPPHNDVPSSAYDLRGWLESSNTFDVSPDVVARAVVRRPREEPFTAKLPPQPDLEVDMLGVDTVAADPPASPAAPGADNPPTQAARPNAESDVSVPVLSAYLVRKGIQLRAQANDLMDVDMNDTAEGPSDVGGSLAGSIWPRYAPAYQPDGQSIAVQRYFGPTRMQLSAETAMRCSNFVHSRPRMRRRPTEKRSAATAPGSGAAEGVDTARSQSKDRSRDREKQLRKSRARQLPRSGSQTQAQIQARFEADMERRVQGWTLASQGERREPLSRPTTDAGPSGT